MGTLINALKEIFSGSSQSSPTNIPTCASDGTPNGNVNMANLASVLGGYSTVEPSSGIDANNIAADNIIHILNGTCISNSSNLPSGIEFGFLTCRQAAAGNTTWSYQFFYEIRTSELYYRVREQSTWRDWRHFSYDIPSFYKDYATLSSLATAVGGVQSLGRTYTGNINDIKTNSICRVKASEATGTLPYWTDWFTLTTLTANGLCGFQIASRNSNDVFARFLWDAVNWSSWYRVSLTA